VKEEEEKKEEEEEEEEEVAVEEEEEEEVVEVYERRVVRLRLCGKLRAGDLRVVFATALFSRHFFLFFPIRLV